MKTVTRRIYLKEGEVAEIRYKRETLLRIAIGRNSIDNDNLMMIDLCNREIGYDWSRGATQYIDRLIEKSE